MKHKPVPPTGGHHPDDSHKRQKSGNGSGHASDAPFRPWFRIAAALLIPCLVLAITEAGLRLSGFGHPTSFFIPLPGAKDGSLVENAKFGWRFFPREAARSPSAMRIQAVKPPGTIRILLFGESAALGDPKPAYGAGRYLEVLLEERFPGSKFEVVCVAMTAINSHAILPIARECAALGGDAWVIYMGNNEMEGPFGAGTLFGANPSSLPVIRATLGLKATRLGQALEEIGRKLRKPPEQPPSWEGMKMFLGQQIPPADPRRQRVHDHFRRNLEDIVRSALGAGAKPILCTVASNLKDCAPFASLHREGLSATDLANWEKLYQQGRELESTNQFADARAKFAEASQIDSSFAELHFRSGACALDQTNLPQARIDFARARDLDALPFRTDALQNDATRKVAERFVAQGAALVDAATRLASESPQGIPGQEFFYDHVHLNFEGNYRLARLIAEQVEKSLPALASKERKPEWASPETCANRLGLTDWNRNAAFESMLQRMADAPFTNQINHAARTQMLVEKIREFRNGMKQQPVSEARTVYENALRQSPNDPRLAENFAEFLEATGALEDAITQWRTVERSLPHHHAAPFQIGRLLGRTGKFDEANKALTKALAIRPDLAEANIELGQVALTRRNNAEAEAQFETARRLRPQDSRIPLLLGKALSAQNRHLPAIASFREAIQLRPRYWEAHYLLGVEFGILNQLPEASAAFTEAVRLRPDYSSARFNLGVSLAKQGRSAEAIVQFTETLRLDPRHSSAAQYLQALQNPGDGSRPQ